MIRLLATIVLVSHFNGIYANRSKPWMVLHGACSLFWSLVLVVLLEAMKEPSLSMYQRWVVFKHFCGAGAVCFILMTVRVHAAVPWWFAVISWMCCANILIVGTLLVAFVDYHSTIIFPGTGVLMLA